MENLEQLKKNIRYHLGNNLSSKYVPNIKFFYDSSILDADKIMQTFKKLEN